MDLLQTSWVFSSLINTFEPITTHAMRESNVKSSNGKMASTRVAVI